MKRRAFLCGLFGAPLLAVAPSRAPIQVVRIDPPVSVAPLDAAVLEYTPISTHHFSGAHLRVIIDQINDLSKDGYPLKRD